MQPERQDADRPCEQRADHDALEHDAGAVQLTQVLKEDHDLAALAVYRGEAEQHEPRQQPSLGRGTGGQQAAAALVRAP